MKDLFFFLLFCFFTVAAYTQKVIEQHLPFSKGKTINMNIEIVDSIRIICWDKSEVYAKASVDINDNKDNDLYKTTFDATGESVRITAKFEDNKNIKQRRSDSCCCNYNSKIYWDIYIPENADMAIETINGNILIQGKTAAVKAHSISGYIDFAFSPSRKTDLKMSTISGTIYTDVAISFNSSDKNESTILSQYNGGGTSVDLETISGDIFLRKAE